jgi:hypothetical protein
VTTTDNSPRVVGNHPRPLLAVIETPWCVQQGASAVECTVHRSEGGGYAVLAGHTSQSLLRIAYTLSLESARDIAGEWLLALMVSGFTIVRVQPALGRVIQAS